MMRMLRGPWQHEILVRPHEQQSAVQNRNIVLLRRKHSMLEDVLVSKLPAFAIAALCVATIAGTAVAATRNSHVMEISLPDGAVAHVEYVGNVAPKVTIEPAATPDGEWAPLPAFAGFDRMIAEMNRQSEALIRQAQQLESQHVGVGAAPYVASFGSSPAGMSSTTIVSYSNGSGTCTRTTEAISQGPGKPPKVSSSVTGNCGASANPVRPAPSSAPISRT